MAGCLYFQQAAVGWTGNDRRSGGRPSAAAAVMRSSLSSDSRSRHASLEGEDWTVGPWETGVGRKDGKMWKQLFFFFFPPPREGGCSCRSMRLGNLAGQ